MKIFSLAILISVLHFACTTKTQDSLQNEANKALAQKLFEIFNKHDWQAYAQCYHPDADFLDPSYGKEYVNQTSQQLIDKYQALEKMSPDIEDEIVGIYSAGNKITVEFISQGTLADGTKWTLPICTVLTFEGDKIIRDATYFNNQN